MNRKLLIITGMVLLFVAGIYGYRYVTTDQELQVGVMDGLTLNLEQTDLRFTYNGTTNVPHIFAEEIRHHWDVRQGFFSTPAELIVAIRTFDDGDVMLFTRLENPGEGELTLPVALEAKGVTSQEAFLYPSDDFEREYDPTLGIDPTSYPTGLFRLEDGEEHRFDLFAGKNHLSTEQVRDYEDGARSVLRELETEEEDLTWTEDGTTKTMTTSLTSEGEDLSEQWLLLSKDPLFDNLTQLEEWQDYTMDNYKYVNKWYTMDGAYRKLPFSIEPFTQFGYGRNLGTMREQVILDRYLESGERFFRTMVQNSVTDLLMYRSGDEEVWKTEYTSTWLKDQWGIRAPFVDTRHNESIALFFLDSADLFEEPALAQEAGHYSRFLHRQVEEGNTIELGDGQMLIADYEGIYDDGLTHASLNHVLGEINFLLRWYLYEGDEADLGLATTLLESVETIGDDWIRDNGDLWYQINPDLSFDGNDYPALTLKDLLKSQELLEAAEQGISEVLEELIASKAAFAVAEGVSLDVEIRGMLEEQGYQDILEEMDEE